MSDDYNKPHFLRHNDEPQQITGTAGITPGKVKGRWVPAIPLYIVRDHPGNDDDRASSTVVEQEAMNKPAKSILPNKGEKR